VKPLCIELFAGLHGWGAGFAAEGYRVDPNNTCRKCGSRSNARKIASALIAKIPFELAAHIARVYKPRMSA
jgi:hypothetical protein